VIGYTDEPVPEQPERLEFNKITDLAAFKANSILFGSVPNAIYLAEQPESPPPPPPSQPPPVPPPSKKKSDPSPFSVTAIFTGMGILIGLIFIVMIGFFLYNRKDQIKSMFQGKPPTHELAAAGGNGNVPISSEAKMGRFVGDGSGRPAPASPLASGEVPEPKRQPGLVDPDSKDV